MRIILVLIITLYTQISFSEDISETVKSLSQLDFIPERFRTNEFKFNEQIVIEIANGVANKRKIDLSKFDNPTVSLNSGNWFVSYQGKSGALGDHFSISISEINKTSFYSPGR